MKYDLTGEQRDRCFPPDKKLSKEDMNTMFPPLTNPIHKKIYVIGALKNKLVPQIAKYLRQQLECDVFDDWHAAHPKADDEWRDYEIERGRTYSEALRAYAGQNVFQFDLKHLNDSTHGILVLPAGKSGHLELGYLAGRGATTAILLDANYDRWDVMYAFTGIVTHDVDEIINSWRDKK